MTRIARTLTAHDIAFRTEVKSGRHRMLADVLAFVGDTGLEPTPYGHLLAALWACTSLTLWMYAERQGWRPEDARVRARHSKVHLAGSAAKTN